MDMGNATDERHDASTTPDGPKEQDAHVEPAHPPTEKTPAAAPAPAPRRRGFAMMDRERVKQIASKGGRAAHAAGTAHQFSSDEARIAGKKGGEAPHVRRGGVRRRPAPEPSSGPNSENKSEPYSAGPR